MNLFQAVIIGAVLYTGYSYFRDTENTRSDIIEYDMSKQPDLGNIVGKYTSLYPTLSSDVEKSHFRTKRKEELASAFPKSKHMKFKGWTGKVDSITTDSRGGISMLKVKSDSSTGKMIFVEERTIKPDFALYKSILDQRLKEGDAVSFVAEIDSGDRQDFFIEKSVTESGSMRLPEFEVRFLSITRSAIPSASAS